VTALRDELYARRSAARAFLPSHTELADRALALPVAADGGAGRARPSGCRSVAVAIKDSGPCLDFDRLTRIRR